MTGVELQAIREKLHLDRKQLAGLSNYTKEHVRRMEKGGRKVSDRMIETINKLQSNLTPSM